MTDINRLFVEQWYQPADFDITGQIEVIRLTDFHNDFNKEFILRRNEMRQQIRPGLFLENRCLMNIIILKRVIKRLSGTSLIRV